MVEDWSALMLRSRTMLIQGPREATDGFILAATPSLQEPVNRYDCDAPLTLPRPRGTLILDAIEALDPGRQEELLGWLDDAQSLDTQLIASTTTPLYARVQAGGFSSRLYYRLNALYIELGEIGEVG